MRILEHGIVRGITKILTPILLLVSLTLLHVDARAVEPSTQLAQYGHAVWRLQEGLLTAAPNVIAQSADGYLWIGTEAGLIQFDGIQFQQWAEPHWKGLPDHEVTALLAASDGTLWIGTPTSLVSWKNGVLTTIGTATVHVNQIVEDRDHRIWFAASRRLDRKALCQVSGTDAKCFGPADGVHMTDGQNLAVKADGSFAVASGDTLIDWSPTKGLVSSYTFPNLLQHTGVNSISSIVIQKDGSGLVGMEIAGSGLGLQRLSGMSQTTYTKPGLDGSALNVAALYTDHSGTFWIGTRDDGIYKIAGDSVSHFNKKDGLSGNFIRDFREDREGNLWVATDGGIDCFRDLKAITWSTDQGLPTGFVRSILATQNNSVLVGIDHTVSVIEDGKVSSLGHGAGLPSGFIAAMVEDSKGKYWIGVDNGLTIFDGHSFTTVKRPNGQPTGIVASLALGSDSSVWALVFAPPQPHAPLREVLHINDGQIIDSLRVDGLNLKLAPDRANGVWISGAGIVSHYANGKLERIRLGAKPDRKAFSALDDLAVSADGTTFLSTHAGLWIVRHGKPKLLDTSRGLPCQEFYGLVFSQQQSLWLLTSCGLIEIEAAWINSWWSQPESKVKYRLIDPFDGARLSRGLFFPRMSLAPDGRIWIANESSVGVIDPTHTEFNSVPPPVHIEEIVANRQELKPSIGLEIGPRTHDLEVRYTALSLSVPQKVRFKYMLEGRDSTWQDPGTRRTAFYSDLKPGRYTFRVTAANDDGVWNEAGDTLEFYVKPAWFQTMWFRGLMVVLLGAAVWAIYRIRISYIADAITARFNERLDERTRVAQDLHDTLLQTVQGSMMIVDGALRPDADDARRRDALGRLSTWLGQAVNEGRATVMALRAHTSECNQLTQYLEQTLKETCLDPALSVVLKVHGDPVELHPIVQSDISLIAREAITNACLHSKASQLLVQLSYARDLFLIVKDSGIGINPEILDSGRAGHFGLQGMKERSERIRAKMAISSSPDSGTEVTLTVRGRVAYRRDRRILHRRLRALLPFRSLAEPNDEINA